MRIRGEREIDGVILVVGYSWFFPATCYDYLQVSLISNNVTRDNKYQN
jgi:hypothetical protein